MVRRFERAHQTKSNRRSHRDWFTFFPLDYFSNHKDLTKTKVLSAFKQASQSNVLTLFVFDNVDNFERIGKLIAELPPKASLIITTTLNDSEIRNSFSEDLEKLNLAPLEKAAQLQLFNELITVPLNRFRDIFTRIITDRKTPILPIELSCMAGFVNLSDGFANQPLLYMIDNYVNYESE